MRVRSDAAYSPSRLWIGNELPTTVAAPILRRLHHHLRRRSWRESAPTPLPTPAASMPPKLSPHIAAFGSTLVAVFQMGRFFNGGASNIGYADLDRWRRFVDERHAARHHDFCRVEPTRPSAIRRSPTIAPHATWLIASLAILNTNDAVVVSRSPDGLTWSGPSPSATRPMPTRTGSPATTPSQPVLRTLLRRMGRSQQQRPHLDEHLDRRWTDLECSREHRR